MSVDHEDLSVIGCACLVTTPIPEVLTYFRSPRRSQPVWELQLGLARVLRNLADNAARHARSQVSIVVRADADNAYLQVCDDGPGIPVAERDRVFERFVRLDADRSRHGGGSGLGLAIVAEIVAAHKGTVDISGREGGGTVLTVRLPLAN
ncbi:hypothetical protein B9M85_13285 [Mycobacteroides abscessus]|nr:hypothetical protein B9M85_13285 [Mycobacteroides abscessus]